MTRRRVLLLGSVAVVTTLAVTAWAVWPRPSAITEENARNLKKGMTLPEVEAILGGRSRDETNGSSDAVWFVVPDGRDYLVGGGMRREEWIGPEWAIAVWFDQDSALDCKSIGRTNWPGPVLRLRRWLGL